MASGTISLGVSGQLEGKLTWSSSTNTSSNSSTVTAKLQVKRTNSYTTSGHFGGYIQIGNYSDDYSTYHELSNSYQTVGTLTKEISHNADGTCSVYLYGSVQGPSGTSQANSVCEAGKTVTLDTIPRSASIDSAESFTDEENPTITYTNQAGSGATSLRACITDSSGNTLVAYRDISKTGTSYTFNLTDAERTALRNACANANSMSVRFYVKCGLSGDTSLSYLTRTMTIVNANPTVTASFVDTNATTIALTGDSSKLVRYYSNVQATINATALKGATISSKSITNGSKTLTENGTFNAFDSLTFNLSATDSRGNIGKNTITASNAIDYVKLTCDIGNGTPDVNGNFKFTVNGKYFNGSFGAVNNSLTVYYRYKVESGSYSSWKAITPTLNGNTYTASDNFTGMDYQTVYTFQAYAVDKLATVYTAETPIQSSPVFDWSKDDFAFHCEQVNVDQNLNVDGTLTIKGQDIAEMIDLSPYLLKSALLNLTYPVGSIYMSVNSTNPGNLFGGTWSQLQNRFLLGAGSSYSNGSTGGASSVTLSVSQIPSHTHDGVRRYNQGGYSGNKSTGASNSDTCTEDDTNATGGGGSHNNMPPYLVVYMWKRTA